jgi:hypothetical protein
MAVSMKMAVLNLNWVVKQVDWSLFSQVIKIEETSFPMVDYMVDKSDPWSSTKPRHVPVSWWMQEC